MGKKQGEAQRVKGNVKVISNNYLELSNKRNYELIFKLNSRAVALKQLKCYNSSLRILEATDSGLI
jgi:hypothetical protein